MPVRDTGRLATSCPVRDPDGTIVLEARGPSRRTSSMYGKTSVSQLLPKVSCRSRTTQRPTCSDGVKKQNSKTKEPLERTATETKHTQLFVPLHCNLENDIVKACGYASSVASINQTDNNENTSFYLCLPYTGTRKTNRRGLRFGIKLLVYEISPRGECEGLQFLVAFRLLGLQST